MRKLLTALLITGALVFVSAGQALAAPVNLVPGGDVSSVASALPASTLVTSLSSAFTGIDAGLKVWYTGTLNQEVRRDNSDGNLIFVYWLTNNAGSLDPIARMTTTDYSSWTTHVAYVSAAGTAPSDFTRNAGAGSTVGFDFPAATGLAAGTTSEKMWIKTNTPHYTIGSTQMLNGAIAAVETYCPAVPEPSSMLLLGLGLFGFAGKVVRKRFIA